MQANNTTILSTRPVDPAWVTIAAGKGIVLDAISFIETMPTPPDEAAEAKMTALYGQPVTVVFTSMNAVEAIATRMDKFRNAGMHDSGWRIFCIGRATRQRVIRYFGENAVAGTADSALELAETILMVFKKETSEKRGQEKRGSEKKIPEIEVSGRVFFFCGDQRRDELPDRLRRNLIEVTEIVVYKTIPTTHLLEERYDGILFFSPSAVDSFFSTNSVPEATVLFAIGPTTAAAIANHSKNRVILSGSPAKESLVRQAIDFF